MPSIQEIIEAKRKARLALPLKIVDESIVMPMETAKAIVKAFELQADPHHKYSPKAPPSVLEIMNTHSSLSAVKADNNLWSVIRIGDRIALQKYYQLQERLAEAPPAKLLADVPAITKPHPINGESADRILEKRADTFSLDIVLNEQQRLPQELLRQGKSCVLTGSAGTGKTTACREMVKFCMTTLNYSPDEIAVVSFTNRATGNIRNALCKDEIIATTLSGQILTIHKILEYQPEFYQHPTEDRMTMRFIPTRTAANPLGIKLLIIEEASMLGLDLWMKLHDAILPGIVIVYVGDINQLPPVFGKSIMNFGLAKLPVVELTEVYRQALDSGIIVNAHRVLKGLPPESNKDCEIIIGKQGVVTDQKRLSVALGKAFNTWYDQGTYDPEQDIILSPWNKQYLGTINLNNWIAQHLGEKRQAMVFEVFAGRRTLYLAVGDKVMVDKQDGIITRIIHNARYIGKVAQIAGTDLNRFGSRIQQAGSAHEDIDNMITGYENINIDDVPDSDEAKRQATHVVTVDLGDGVTVDCMSVGDFSEQSFTLGYVLTVHKAQGCEWRKVFFILHQDHLRGGFLSRELMYTGITRAKEKLILIAKPNVLKLSVERQVIKGQTLQEKIAFINSGANNIGDYPVTKEGEWDDSRVPAKQREKKEREKIAAIQAVRPKIAFVDMSKYVSEDIRQTCKENLSSYWQTATEIWGDEIGDVPSISFDCQKATCLGLASPAKWQIKLNPVLCTLAASDPHWHHEMTDTTIAHEVAHLVTARYVKQTGHGKDWVMTMKLLKQKPEALYAGPMPDWKQACKDIIGNQDIDLRDAELEEGEEA